MAILAALVAVFAAEVLFSVVPRKCLQDIYVRALLGFGGVEASRRVGLERGAGRLRRPP